MGLAGIACQAVASDEGSIRSHPWAGIPSKTAEAACLWTVTILDDPKFKEINFAAPRSVNHVPGLVSPMLLNPSNIDHKYHKLACSAIYRLVILSRNNY